MAITKALEFDQTANKLLFQVGEEAKQQRLQEEKLKAENNDRMLRVMSGLNPDVLSTRYRKEVVDAGLKDLMDRVSYFHRSNPNASPIEMQDFINKSVSEMGQWSARVDANSKAIDESIEMLGGIGKKGSIYLPTLKAAAENEALYKTDELGRKVLRPYNEMPVVTTDFVQKLVNENPENFIDAAQIDRMYTSELGDESLFKKSETIIETTPDGRKTQKEVSVSALPYFMQEKDGVADLKLEANGYISEDVYEKTISDPAREVWVRSMAKSNMRKAGVDMTPENEEIFKRAALTKWLESKKRGFVSKLESVGYKPPPRPSAGITVNVGGTQPYRKGYEELYKDVKANKFSETSPSLIKYLLSVADSEGKRKAAGLKYSKSDIDVRLVGDKLKLFDKKTNEEIATFNERDFDQQYNRAEFTPQAAGNASGVSWN